MKNIVLIGFMGCGKSSVGALLARQNNSFLLDTDMIIESTYKQSITEIFATYGESGFRDMESSLLEFLKVNVDNCIIATGGGFGTQKGIKELGEVVFLDISIQDILRRFESLDNEQKNIELFKRPLLKDRDTLISLYQSRIQAYKQNADVSIDATLSIEQIARQIQRLIF